MIVLPCGEEKLTTC